MATLVRLAAQQSALEITTADIAKAMNLSQGALFKHFPNKEAIRLAVVDWIEATLMQRLNAARQTATTPLVALHDMFMTHVRFFIEYPGAPRFIFGELQQAEATPVKSRVCLLMQHYRFLLNDTLGTALAAGLIRANIDRAAAAALFLGAIQGLVIQAMVSGQTAQSEAQAETIFQLYLLGLGAKP